MYFLIFSYGLFIVVIFSLLNITNRLLPISKASKMFISNALPFVELIIWLSYLIWAVRKIYQGGDMTSIIVAGVILLLLLIPGFFLIRDFLTGFSLKIQRKIDINSTIDIEGITGIVRKTGRFYLEIENEDGMTKSIPYSRIRSKIIAYQGKNNSSNKQLIHFNTELDCDENILKQKIVKALKYCPWISARNNPTIQRIEKRGTGCSIYLIVFLLDPKHVDRISNYLVKHIK